MGGIVALALADRFPAAFHSVGVIGLPVFRDRRDGLACLRRRGPIVGAMLQDDRLAHLACVGMRHTWPLWLPFAPLALPGRPRHAVRHLFEHTGASHAGGLDAVVFGGLVGPLAEQLTVPVAALHGGRDQSAPAERVRELGASLGWDIRIAPRLGHQIPIVRPALTARWIREHVLSGDAIPDTLRLAPTAG
jgi:pimeloyl-ACP methyl ester carboxylesterase